MFLKQTSDCGKEYSCFKSPNDCIDKSCDYLAKWKRVDDEKIEFLLSSKMSANNWLAIGFSKDQKMVCLKIFPIFGKNFPSLNNILHLVSGTTQQYF